MPEGHTIHRLARDHNADLAGQKLRASSPQGRFADGAAALDGELLEEVEPYGKHLFYRWEGDRVVHVHLGLYGKWFRLRTPAGATRYQVRLRLEGESWTADLLAPTACELGTSEMRDRIVGRLGPDPLRDDADPDEAFRRLSRRKIGIGQALMDQAVLAGVGNVYRAESLWLHGIHPLVPANTVDRATFDDLWSTLVRLMRHGVEVNRILPVIAMEGSGGSAPLSEGAAPPRRLSRRTPKASTRLEGGGAEPSGDRPKPGAVADDEVDQHDARYVYRQEHCRRCGTPVRRWDLAGRWAYACETCQPPP